MRGPRSLTTAPTEQNELARRVNDLMENVKTFAVKSPPAPLEDIEARFIEFILNSGEQSNQDAAVKSLISAITDQVTNVSQQDSTIATIATIAKLVWKCVNCVRFSKDINITAAMTFKLAMLRMSALTGTSAGSQLIGKLLTHAAKSTLGHPAGTHEFILPHDASGFLKSATNLLRPTSLLDIHTWMAMIIHCNHEYSFTAMLFEVLNSTAHRDFVFTRLIAPAHPTVLRNSADHHALERHVWWDLIARTSYSATDIKKLHTAPHRVTPSSSPSIVPHLDSNLLMPPLDSHGSPRSEQQHQQADGASPSRQPASRPAPKEFSIDDAIAKFISNPKFSDPLFARPNHAPSGDAIPFVRMSSSSGQLISTHPFVQAYLTNNAAVIGIVPHDADAIATALKDLLDIQKVPLQYARLSGGGMIAEKNFKDASEQKTATEALGLHGDTDRDMMFSCEAVDEMNAALAFDAAMDRKNPTLDFAPRHVSTFYRPDSHSQDRNEVIMNVVGHNVPIAFAASVQHLSAFRSSQPPTLVDFAASNFTLHGQEYMERLGLMQPVGHIMPRKGQCEGLRQAAFDLVIHVRGAVTLYVVDARQKAKMLPFIGRLMQGHAVAATADEIRAAADGVDTGPLLTRLKVQCETPVGDHIVALYLATPSTSADCIGNSHFFVPLEKLKKEEIEVTKMRVEDACSSVILAGSFYQLVSASESHHPTIVSQSISLPTESLLRGVLEHSMTLVVALILADIDKQEAKSFVSEHYLSDTHFLLGYVVLMLRIAIEVQNDIAKRQSGSLGPPESATRLYGNLFKQWSNDAKPGAIKPSDLWLAINNRCGRLVMLVTWLRQCTSHARVFDLVVCESDVATLRRSEALGDLSTDAFRAKILDLLRDLVSISRRHMTMHCVRDAL